MLYILGDYVFCFLGRGRKRGFKYDCCQIMASFNFSLIVQSQISYLVSNLNASNAKENLEEISQVYI